MNYINFETSKGSYKLRLNTRTILVLENLLGGNPLKVFANVSETEVPTIESMTNILYASLLAYQPEIKKEQAFDIFDEWLEAGHHVAEFVIIAIDLYKQGGLIKREAEKN